MRRLEASRNGRRVAHVLALVLVCFAVAFVACAALVLLHFGALYPAEIRWIWYLPAVVGGLVMLWGAYLVYLPAHTVFEFTSVSARLSRPLPFREWSGPWRDVRWSFLHNGLLAIRTTERLWPGWAIKVDPADRLLVDELQTYLGQGVWRDRGARLRTARKGLHLVHAILFGLGLLAYFLARAFR
jgi:hypothetical protein